MHLWQKVPDGDWTQWESLGEPDGGSGGYGPAVARNSDGCLEVVVNTLEGAAWHRWQQHPSGWSARTRQRSVNLFTGDSELFQRWQFFDGSGWGPLVAAAETPPVPGEEPEKSTLALNAKGQLELWFTIQNTMDLYRLKQTTPNGTEWKGERFSDKEPV